MSSDEKPTRPLHQLFRVEEVAEHCGVQATVIISFIEREWLRPVTPPPVLTLDAEDIARARLIHELREELGVNDEAVPIILDLLDQLHCLRTVALRGSRSA